MGRGRVQLKRIENKINRQVTFAKRRNGLLKKANELSILCDVEVALVIFSNSGKLYEFCSSNSMLQTLEKYQRAKNGTPEINITSGEIQGLGRRNQRRGSPRDVRSPNEAIIIVPDENSCKGSSFNDPIKIDDEVEFLGMVEMSRGSNRENPILVEQRPKRSRSFKMTLMEAPWAGKPVIEIGESSGISLQEKLEMECGGSSGLRPVRLKPDCNCEICTESKYSYELFAIEGCSHTYCKSCVSQYVAAKLEENVLFIKCPDPNCIKGKLEPAMCSRILEVGIFDLWCKSLCELMVNNKFYCPFKDCSALMINDKEEVITDAECPHCNRLFCAQCRVPWHEGFSCSEFQKLGKDERKNEDLKLMKLAKESKWQRCPKCKFFVERIDGCMFITCRCRFTFCYGCASEMKVNHYCEKCKR